MLYRSKNLSLRLKKSDKPKVYFVVSKKIYKSAVRRNLIKRRLRHALKSVSPQLSLKGNNFILYPKKGVIDLKYKELKEELKNILSSAKLV